MTDRWLQQRGISGHCNLPNAIGLAWVCVLVGCSPSPPPVVTISSEPTGATIYLDGKEVGKTSAPTTLPFDSVDRHEISLKLVGMVDEKRTLNKDSQAVADKELNVVLVPDEAMKGTVANDGTGADDANQAHPFQFQVNSALTKEAAWTQIVGLVNPRYGGTQQVDASSGLLQSLWIERSFSHPHRKGVTVRTQFLGSFASQDPLAYKVIIKTEISYADAPDKWEPYGRCFKEDKDLLAMLRKTVDVPH